MNTVTLNYLCQFLFVLLQLCTNIWAFPHCSSCPFLCICPESLNLFQLRLNFTQFHFSTLAWFHCSCSCTFRVLQLQHSNGYTDDVTLCHQFLKLVFQRYKVWVSTMLLVILIQVFFLIRRAVKEFPEFLWLKKCDNWFNMIKEWPSWSWNKTLASLTDPFMRFFPTIWRWDLLVRSLFRVNSASRWRTEPHITGCAAIPRQEKHSCHHPTTVLSGSRSGWLSAVPYSENVPQGDAFRTMEDIESNVMAELRKIPKEAFRQCIQQRQDRWSTCVCAQGSDFEGD